MTQTVSTYIQWHAERIKEDKEWRVKNLATRLTQDQLREAYNQVRRNGATGVDKVTWGEYGRKLDSNLEELERRLREQKYRAPAVKRAWIPKEGGKRPLGIPTLEDKVVQTAVKSLMEPIYEAVFRDCSYGFRPGRNAHQAITKVRDGTMYENLRWIIDADIMQYFDTIKHELLKDVVKQRVEDGRIVRLIGKWLNAGIMDGKKLSYPETGTPQGGVISPLLANIYLDQVLDAWFEDVVPHYLRGRVRLIRFADDFVIGCEYEEDAHRVMAVLHKRLEKYGLKIHPDKTRLVDMRIPTKGKKGNTFNFLGFTFYWARSRRGYWVIKKRTMAKRKQRAIKRNWLWCKRNRHESVKHQHKRLSQKLQGYYNYFGVIGNYGAIMAVYHWTKMAWKYWLGRRGGKRRLTWERFEAILVTFPLPTPRIVHNI